MAHLTFKQAGFTDGGIVTGSFDGKDTVGNMDSNGMPIPDGLITACSGRSCSEPAYDGVSSFSIHFSGNPLFNSLDDLPDTSLGGIDYRIKSNSLMVWFGSRDTSDRLPWMQYNSEGMLHLLTSESDFHLTTTQGITVTETPLPGALGLFVTGIAWLSGFRRKSTNL
ncbi:hypothetical protein [Methyloglobulus sp.]|uniref:hypothetical protein n=1 Tax=Methyloglobulus sp. TaxID=2518622 RepID=UPI0032B7640D